MRLGVMYLGKAGGIANSTYELVRELSPKIPVTCYLATQLDLLGKFQALPCTVHAFAMRRGPKALMRALILGREPSGIARAILNDQPDILLDTGSEWWSLVVERQLKRRVPIAEMVHDVQPHPGAMARLSRLRNLLYPPVADALISLSDYSHQELVRIHPNKKHIQSKLGVILSGDPASPDSVAANRHKMLFFGRIDAYKGLELLVDAFALARQSGEAIELDVVGSGTIAPELLARMQQLGIGVRNEWVSDEEAAALVHSHGVIMLPYVSATQSGVAAVALANGLPCIATNVGALAEQVVDGKNGLIVPPNDPQALAAAMVRLSQSEDSVRAMAEEALHMGETEYSWDVIAARLLSDLEAMAAGNRE